MAACAGSGAGGCAGQCGQQRCQALAAIGQHLAHQQVDGLDLVGALVDHGHTRVAHDLLDAPFTHIAVAAKHLQAGAGAVKGLVGECSLEHGRDQRAPALRGGAFTRVGAVLGHIELQGGVVGQHAAAVDPSALCVQDAADGGVVLNEAGVLGAWRAHLAALCGVGAGLLPGGFQQANALQAHVQAGSVHHHEHGVQALVRLAHQPAGGVVKAHHAGGAAVQAHLFFDALADHGVVASILKNLGHQEQRQALGPRRRIGQAGQHQVHDVVRQVVFAAGDENLAAVHPRAAVGLGHAACAHHSQVAARMGFGQAHGGQPFAGGDLLQVLRLEFVAGVVLDAFVRAVQQAGGHGPAVVGAGQPFKQHTLQHRRQALAAIVGRARQRRPARLPKGLVRIAKTCGGVHLPAVKAAAFFVAAALQRGDGAVHELGRLVEHLGRQVAIGICKRRQALPARGRLQHGGQQVLDVGKGLAGLHGLLSFG